MQCDDQNENPQRGGAAGLVGAGDLGEEGPQDDGGVVDAACGVAEVYGLAQASLTHLLVREDIGEGQSVVAEEKARAAAKDRYGG